MAEVILIGGKLCCGKTTYSKQLCNELNAVLLSVDEIMLGLFENGCGDLHDHYVAKTKNYLLDKSLDILNAGASVVLDWGFWTKSERDFVRSFYENKNIKCRLHYLNVSDEIWQRRIEKRNNEKSDKDYYVDAGLLKKFTEIFEEFEGSEIDVLVDIK